MDNNIIVPVDTDTQSRDKVIVKTSIVGIAANVLLAAFKAAIGIIANSIAVTLDAVNNLTDALSSVITIIGTKLAAKKPDKKHPIGYGRIEYLSTLIIAAIVLYAGVTSFVESVKKIITPQEADYSTVSLIIIAVAVAVKVLLGTYVKAKGRKVNSGSLIASGSDALFDAILSSSVLITALIYVRTGVSLEAYVGVVISCFIIKSGLEILKETIDDLLGKRTDPELTKEIKRVICETENVSGAYDLFLNNYGPDKEYGSVHIEIPDTLTAKEIDTIQREVQANVYEKTGVIMTGISIYTINMKDGREKEIYEAVKKTVTSHDWILQMHGFYIDEANKSIRFDVVLDFSVDPRMALTEIYNEVRELYPEYAFIIVPDVDVSD